MKSLSYLLNPAVPRNLDDLLDFLSRHDHQNIHISLDFFTEERVSPDSVLKLYCGRYGWVDGEGDSREYIKIYGGEDEFSSKEKRAAGRFAAEKGMEEDLARLNAAGVSVQNMNISPSFK